MTGGKQSVLQWSEDILRARTGDAQVGLRRKVGHGVGGSVARWRWTSWGWLSCRQDVKAHAPAGVRNNTEL